MVIDTNRVILALVLIFLKREVESFSFNVNARIVFSPDKYENNHSYFGYSIALREGDSPVILVGAPRDTSKFSDQSSVEDPGAIYQCDINTEVTKSTCVKKIIDSEGNAKYNLANGKSYHHHKDHMWLGMTLDGTKSINGPVVACAPRWINAIFLGHYRANGLCYLISDMETKNTTDIAQLFPLSEPHKQGFPAPNSTQMDYFYAYGQAGMSIKLSEDGSELILGAPGIYLWTGSVVRYTNKKKHGNISRKLMLDIIPNPYFTSELSESAYFGYSVDSGKFISGRSNLYVAGAPRGSDYKGQVLLFDFPLQDNARYVIFAILEGHQFGEYFGSTLAAIDINQDGLSDLIVGAPMHADKYNSDQGRVYVYMNHDKANLIEQDATIGGRLQSGARFGSSISAIGDINNDGFMDVAIGAPYEDNGKGAVYIYLGAANGLNPNYTQCISMDDMRGFGISISQGVDIDRNSCNDLAIGAHDSANVVLIRCHSSIDVTSTIEAFPSELSLEITNFTAKICHTFSGSRAFATEINVSLLVDLEYKSASLETLSDATYSVPGFNGETYCKEAVILIDSKQNNDFSRPIDVEMSFDLSYNPVTDSIFCADCVVLCPSTKKRTSLRIPFASGCGDDLVCQPDLKLSVTVLNEIPYVIGSSSNLTVNISVENVGEPAFLSRVELSPPAVVPLLRVPQNCHLLDSLLSCDFHNPLATGARDFLVIELDVSSLTSFHSLINFSIIAISGGDEVTPEDNIQTLKIELKTKAKIVIVGEAANDAYVYINPSLKKQTNVTISHAYEILNEGPTSLDILLMNYYIPVAYFDDKTKTKYNLVDLLNPVDKLNHAPFFCDVDNRNFVLKDDLWRSIYDEKYSHEVSQHGTLLTTQEKVVYTEKPETNDNLFSFDLFGSNGEIEFPKAHEDRLTGGMHLNCSDTVHVTCLVVNCVKSGGLPAGGNGAHMLLNMRLNVSNIEKILKHKKSIMLTTYGVASQKKRVFSLTQSLVIGSAPPPAPTPIWVYILGTIAGILLLALISYALYKHDFFKRKTNETLQLLKNEKASFKQLTAGGFF